MPQATTGSHGRGVQKREYVSLECPDAGYVDSETRAQGDSSLNRTARTPQRLYCSVASPESGLLVRIETMYMHMKTEPNVDVRLGAGGRDGCLLPLKHTTSALAINARRWRPIDRAVSRHRRDTAGSNAAAGATAGADVERDPSAGTPGLQAVG